MLLRDEVHKRSATEHRPVHMVLPCPVSWVPEVRPSSGEGAPEKRSPGTAIHQAGKRSSQEVTQASLLQGTTGLSLPGRSGCQSV